MTTTTIVQGRNMIRFSRRLAGCAVTVMANCAAVNNVRVINRRPRKGVSRVTDRAILRGRYVIRRHSSTDHIIVAQDAVINDTRMIKRTTGKRARRVTHATIGGGWYVIFRQTNSVRTIVARNAIVHETGVVDKRIGEISGIMAHGAIRVVRIRMVLCWLTRRIGAIVTGCTRLRHRINDSVIENATQIEGLRVMAYTTISRRYRMIRGLSGSLNAIMTGGAIAGNCAVIKYCG